MAKKKAKKKTRTKKKKHVPKKELFYVGVRNSVDVRRNILESTKEFVQVLQMYSNFIKLRGDISDKVEKLQKDIKKIKALNSRLKRLMPDTGLRAGLVKKKKPKKEKQEKTHKKKHAKPVSELDQLESELNMIESKLNKIR
tara:strand:- start:13626 stop:14048 length:423 start_codon:yes stop_codon:yes gene_type:complete